MAPRPASKPVSDWETVPTSPANDWETVSDWETVGADSKPKTPERVGGQKVLDYANETLSNVPKSALKFGKNILQTARHPIDTAANLGKIATGTLQNMTPGYVTPERPGYSAEANAALKDRYGSVDAILNTIKTDPVGAAADASAVLGGVSGLARGVSAGARAAGLPRVAGVASDVAQGAGFVSDVANPLTLPLMGAGAGAKAVGRHMVKSALGLPGKAERYGADPATAALEQTRGIQPATIQASAEARLATLNKQLDALSQQAAAQGNTGSLAPAIKVIEDEIAKVQRGNALPGKLNEMREQLTEVRPGFGGATNYPPGANTPYQVAAGASGTPLPPIVGNPPSPVVSTQQSPPDLLAMKRQFGDDFTKFDYAVPLKNSDRATGNKAYHELASEFNRATPGAQPINRQIQDLIPVKVGAQQAHERIGPTERAIDRATRHTGGMVLPAAGMAVGGLPAAVGLMTLQEIIASPAARMALARTLYGTGKGISAPATRRIGTALGVAGEATPDLPRFAKGGIAGKDGPETVIVGDGGEPEAILPLSYIRTSIGPKAQRRLLRGIGSHLGIGTPRKKSTLGAQLAHARNK